MRDEEEARRYVTEQSRDIKDNAAQLLDGFSLAVKALFEADTTLRDGHQRLKEHHKRVSRIASEWGIEDCLAPLDEIEENQICIASQNLKIRIFRKFGPERSHQEGTGSVNITQTPRESQVLASSPLIPSFELPLDRTPASDRRTTRDNDCRGSGNEAPLHVKRLSYPIILPPLRLSSTKQAIERSPEPETLPLSDEEEQDASHRDDSEGQIPGKAMRRKSPRKAPKFNARTSVSISEFIKHRPWVFSLDSTDGLKFYFLTCKVRQCEERYFRVDPLTNEGKESIKEHMRGHGREPRRDDYLGIARLLWLFGRYVQAEGTRVPTLEWAKRHNASLGAAGPDNTPIPPTNVVKGLDKHHEPESSIPTKKRQVKTQTLKSVKEDSPDALAEKDIPSPPPSKRRRLSQRSPSVSYDRVHTRNSSRLAGIPDTILEELR